MLDLNQVLAHVLVLFLCIPAHECAHGWVAYRLGDDTAKLEGRLTLNPLRHLDFLGTLSLVLLGVGWARPVPVNPMNFKGNKKRGMALTALAGPVANALMALALMVVYKAAFYTMAALGMVPEATALGSAFVNIMVFMILTNVSLAVFNLLPVNPLDGSRIIGFFLPDKIYFGLMKYERYIYAVLLVVLVTGLLDTPLSLASSAMFRFLNFITSFIDSLARLLLAA